jgi:hypothetical protein
MGWIKLHDLAIKNEPSEIKDSVLIAGNVRERVDLTGMTPILIACMYGRLGAFLELQELGARALF